MIAFAFVIAFGGSPLPSPTCPRNAGARPDVMENTRANVHTDPRANGCASASQTMRGGDRWFARDKLLHFTASALIQGAAHAAFRSRGADYGAASRGAAAVTLTAGIGKEIWDRYHAGHDASLRDLAWDVAGGATAAATVRQVDR